MSAKPAVSESLLNESEETLRLIDSLLDEFQARGDDGEEDRRERLSRLLDRLQDRPGARSALPILLLRAYEEISGALEALRQSRGILERATVERVQQTHEKLREVSSATELATTDILNGLDHAISLVDRLDDLATSDDASHVRTELREELFRLIGCLQFQDITSQQLQYASSVLLDVEQRLAAVADLFDIGMSSAQAGVERSSLTYDPGASMLNAERRQALVDEIFTNADAQDRAT